jgi:hypothetical protein
MNGQSSIAAGAEKSWVGKEGKFVLALDSVGRLDTIDLHS